MIEKDPFTQEVIGAALAVHRELGPGLLESVYQRCLGVELKQRGIEYRPQARVPIKYKGVILDEYLVIDFYFPDRLIVELKAVETLLDIHEAQLLTYLRLTGTHVGLLINFNVRFLRDGIKRMVL